MKRVSFSGLRTQERPVMRPSTTRSAMTPSNAPSRYTASAGSPLTAVGSQAIATPAFAEPPR